MFGFGLRYKLERAETALRAALAERDDYLRQLAVALGERDERGGSVTTFSANSTASPPTAGWRARDDPGSMAAVPAAACEWLAARRLRAERGERNPRW
jgi:hypothetical protein